MSLLSLLILTAALAPRPSQSGDLPDLVIGSHTFQRRELTNGLRAVAVRDEQETVSVFVTVGVGNRQETPATTGLAHLVEHAMFSGTLATGTDEHEKRVVGWGGESNAFTRDDHTVYYDHNFGLEHLGEVLAMEADRLRGLAFFEKAVLHERHRLELEERHTFQPSEGRAEQLEDAVFRTHPYGAGLRDAQGLTKAPGLPVATVKAFYDRYYHPNNVSVVVVGPIDESAALDAIEQAFAQLPRGAELAAPAPEEWFRARTVRIESQLARDRTVLTWLIPQMGHPDRPALEVLAQWLDRQDASDGRVLKATLGGRVDRDLLQFSGSAAGALEELLAIAAGVRQHELSAQQLGSVQGSMGDEFENLPLRARPYFSLAGTVGVYEVLGYSTLLAQHRGAIARVTRSKLRDVARLYLSPERCTTVIFEGTGAPLKPLPSSAKELYAAAVQASEVGDHERAIEAFTRMLALGPNRMNKVIYLASRGQVYLERKDFDGAIADFEEALAVIDYPAVRELLEDTLARKSAASRGDFGAEVTAPPAQPTEKTPDEGVAEPGAFVHGKEMGSGDGRGKGKSDGHGGDGAQGDADLRAELLAAVEDTKAELEAWRGLRFMQPVEPEFVESVADEKLGGWYEPDTGRLVVVMGKGSKFSRGTQLHELFHALQDQAWDLSYLQSQTKSSDAADALQGLIEGEAMLAVSEIMDYDFERHAHIPATGSIDRARFDKLFYYGTGLRYVRTLRDAQGDAGGWAAVNRSWGRLPRTTAEIYHPARSQRVGPVDWSALPLRGEICETDQVGEHALRWMLVREEATRSLADSLGSAWDGDRLLLLQLGSGERVERWDLRLASSAAAEQFMDAARPAWAARDWTAQRVGRVVRLARPAPD